MNKPAAALFDLDGVLLDTEPAYTRIWSDIESHFPTGYADFARRIKGSTLPQILETYFPGEDTRRQVCAMLAEREEAMDYQIFDGVTDFLAQLSASGVPAAIVTSSGDAKMQRIFASKPDFAAYFSALVTDSSVSRSKPDPECYLVGASMLGVDPSECVVFEDSYAGLRAGRAAGAYVVALATTNPRETLVDLADMVIDGFAGMNLDDLLI